MESFLPKSICDDGGRELMSSRAVNPKRNQKARLTPLWWQGVSGSFADLAASFRGGLVGNRKRRIIIVTWLLLFLTSVPFDRVNYDEVLFFLEAQHVLSVGPFAHGLIIFIPEILGAIALGFYNSLFATRIVSGIVVLVTAILIYSLKKTDETFVSAMLFVTSYYTIRYGFRYFLDPYGALFVIATIYLLHKEKAGLAGLTSVFAAFSTLYAAPLFPVFAGLVCSKRMSFRRFILGSAIAGVLGFAWIYLSSSGLNEIVATNVSSMTQVSEAVTSLAPSILKSWLQFALISPLVVLGLIFAENRRKRLEFYPIIVGFATTSFVPGFLQFGGATQYPFIFNAIACLTAGAGLVAVYERLVHRHFSLIKVIVVILLLQFGAQNYFATTLNTNHEIGVADYGYWYDQQLLSYMDNHYTGGRIYSAISVGLLDSRLASNWTLHYGVEYALRDNPQWLVTYNSYVTVRYIPENASIVTIGPYLVVNRGSTPLASFLQATNGTGLFQYEPQD